MRTDLFLDAAAGHVAARDPHGGLPRAASQGQERGACGHRAFARCAVARGRGQQAVCLCESAANHSFGAHLLTTVRLCECVMCAKRDDER